MAVLFAVMAFSIGKIVGYHTESAQNQNNIKELITAKDSKAENYRRIKEKNPDIIGWIKIPETKIDYPVMWTPDNPEKYLRTDFNGNYALCGLPFAAAGCRISSDPGEQDCINTLIYGHHMQGRTMFAELVDYEKQEFADKHGIIEYDRIFEYGSYKEYEYKVVGALKTEVNTANINEFRYYDYADLSDIEDFNEFQISISERNLISVKHTEFTQFNLLTLSPCSYHVAWNNGRFIVIANLKIL